MFWQSFKQTKNFGNLQPLFFLIDKLFILYKFLEEGEFNQGFPGETLTWARLSVLGEFYAEKKNSTGILQDQSPTGLQSKFKFV